MHATIEICDCVSILYWEKPAIPVCRQCPHHNDWYWWRCDAACCVAVSNWKQITPNNNSNNLPIHFTHLNFRKSAVVGIVHDTHAYTIFPTIRAHNTMAQANENVKASGKKSKRYKLSNAIPLRYTQGYLALADCELWNIPQPVHLTSDKKFDFPWR